MFPVVREADSEGLQTVECGKSVVIGKGTLYTKNS